MRWRNRHLPLPPTSPLHRGARLGRHGREGGGTCPGCQARRERGAAIALPSPGCTGEGHTPELPPAPPLPTCVWWGARRRRLSSPRTGHENGVRWSPHPSDGVGAPTALGPRSPRPSCVGRVRRNRPRGAGCWLPTSPRPEQGVPVGGKRSGDPSGAALRPAPVALVARQGWKVAVRRAEGPSGARQRWGWSQTQLAPQRRRCCWRWCCGGAGWGSAW